MARFSVAKYVDAPPSQVFALFTDFEHAPDHVSGITRLEILTPGPMHIGTRLRETRKVGRHESTEELEVTAFEPGRHYDLRRRSGGTEYRSAFRFSPERTGTQIEVDVESEPLSLAAKLITPLLTNHSIATMKKAIVQDIEDLRRYAERH
jgi:ribosome-associated toxin RatA of RatAB toxin-antitoxin module